MGIDIHTEKIIPILAAAALIPGRHPGKPIAFSTLFRWLLRGAKTPDGRRIKLEGVRLGSKWFTTAEALQRFADALTPATGDAPLAIRPPTARQRATKHAGEELKKNFGI